MAVSALLLVDRSEHVQHCSFVCLYQCCDLMGVKCIAAQVLHLTILASWDYPKPFSMPRGCT
jgi:hypothetical protein